MGDAVDGDAGGGVRVGMVASERLVGDLDSARSRDYVLCGVSD